MPLGEELYDIVDFKFKKYVPFFKRRLRAMDYFAFNRADFIVFPCEDAEEPYINRWEGYKELKKKKQAAYRYVLTGIPKVEAKRPKNDVFRELNIRDNSFLVSYAGRHNEAKGYDLLKNIGETFLNQHTDATFVIAGKESPLTRLDHKRWVELGWTDDAKSYIAASDVFLLPNRETYFDIVMLEVLSLGKIVIASRTGGNKYFEKNNCPGVMLYDTLDECLQLLHKVYVMSKEERESLEKQNYEFYSNNLTVEKMYNSYLQMLSTLI